MCAHETHIWAKKGIATNWESLKTKLNAGKLFRLKDAGLFPYGGINKEEIPNFSNQKFDSLIKGDHGIASFFDAFMKEFYVLKLGQIFGEKTPANSINFKDILKTSNQILCIHTIRNPYDTIASLVARGKSIPEAVGFYLYNCSHALSAGPNQRLLTIRYENLVSNPKEELESLMEYLALDLQDEMLLPSKPKEGELTKIESWKYDEAGKIGKGSIGRFKELSEEQQDEIISFVWNMKLKEPNEHPSIQKICETLEYEIIEPKDDFDTTRKSRLESFNKKLVLSNVNFLFKTSPFTF